MAEPSVGESIEDFRILNASLRKFNAEIIITNAALKVACSQLGAIIQEMVAANNSGQQAAIALGTELGSSALTLLEEAKDKGAFNARVKGGLDG